MSDSGIHFASKPQSRSCSACFTQKSFHARFELRFVQGLGTAAGESKPASFENLSRARIIERLPGRSLAKVEDDPTLRRIGFQGRFQVVVDHASRHLPAPR